METVYMFLETSLFHRLYIISLLPCCSKPPFIAGAPRNWDQFVAFVPPNMSSLVQLPTQPSSAFQLDFDAVRNFQNVPPVDLEGGTLIDATEVRNGYKKRKEGSEKSELFTIFKFQNS